MNDQPTHGPDTGRQEPTGNDLVVKARHREEMARIEAEIFARQLHGLPFAARMYFDPKLFDRMHAMALMMTQSKAMPRHVQGDPIMGLYCIERGWSWGMSPLAVAMGTFKVGEQIGHYGRTIIAAINNSTRLEGALAFEHFEEVEAKTWANVTAKFTQRPSKTKKNEHGEPVEYLVPAYTRVDEEGLGVIVRGRIKGEDAPRELRFYLKQCWPRNSTLWATDPKTQICYTAARRFGNLFMPEIIAGARTEDDFEPPMVDITPAAAVEPRAPQDAAPPRPMPIRRAREEVDRGARSGKPPFLVPEKEQKRKEEASDGDHPDGEAAGSQDPEAGGAADQGSGEAKRAQPAGAEAHDGPRGEDPQDTFEFDGVSGSAEELTEELIRRVEACEEEGHVFQLSKDAMGVIGELNAAGYTQQADAVGEAMQARIDQLRKPEGDLPFDQPRRQPGKLSGGLGGKK